VLFDRADLVLDADGVAARVTFLVDPNNEVQFVSATAGPVGRKVDEVLRVLDGLSSKAGTTTYALGCGDHIRCGTSDYRLPDTARGRLIAAT